jgi:hypothetical protein
MNVRMSDSGMLDLYDEMLYARVAKGIRPVLYISSPKDLECSILILLNRPPEGLLASRQQPASRGLGHQVRTI